MSGTETVLRDVPAKVHIVVREGQAGYQVESRPGSVDRLVACGQPVLVRFWETPV